MTKTSTRARPARERFEALCIPEPPSGCLLWLGALDSTGYGSFFDGERVVGAHRFACEQVHGPLALGMEALHSCDTSCCVEGAHLRPGTKAENVRDAVRRDRLSRGTAHYNAKLDEIAVARGRALGMSPAAFAKKHGVTWDAAEKALSGKTWRRVRMLWDRA